MPVAASTAGRECVDVDPTSLIIGDNVRAGAHLDRQFLASLREFAVMDPIHVTLDQDGTLTVKRGQRRTLGAVKVGLPLVPVDSAEDEPEGEVRQPSRSVEPTNVRRRAVKGEDHQRLQGKQGDIGA